jgi:hypothetical protein
LKSLSKVAKNDFFAFHTKVQTVLNDELVANFSISLSLSTIKRTATDCTLQADNHFATFLRNTGDNSNQTKRSKTLLACWASTNFISNVLGFSTACLIAFSVISWKTILGVLSIGNQSWFATCQPIASHSRSSSVASHTLSDSFANFFSSATTFFLSGLTS